MNNYESDKRGDDELEARLGGHDLFELMEKLWSKCIVTSSNYGGTNEKIVRGLVCGHAYRNKGDN